MELTRTLSHKDTGRDLGEQNRIAAEEKRGVISGEVWAVVRSGRALAVPRRATKREEGGNFQTLLSH